MSPAYTAVCECGRSNTVTPDQMGGRHPCHCGFMLLIPAAAEFDRDPVQVAYPSVLRKVHARIEGGLLPGVDDCQACGTPADRQVEALVVCEQSRTESVGGNVPWVIILAVFSVLVLPVSIFLHPDGGETTHHGRDKSARVPVCLCEPCQRRLSSRRNPLVWGVLAGGVLVSGLVGVFAGWWAVLPAVATLFPVAGVVRSARARQRRECKEMLATVPGYAELLKAFRFAEVHVPRVR